MSRAESAYSKKLKDPRWQKKRLEVLQRDNWQCQWCGDESSTLHVHHLEYRRDAQPWEYEEWELLTVCEECHQQEYEYRREGESDLLSAVRLGCINARDLCGLSWAFRKLGPGSAFDFVRAACWLSDHPEEAFALSAKEQERRNAALADDEDVDLPF